jgi:hypothetical protein
MTLTLWLCTLPLVAFVVLLFWGSRAALVSAMVLLVAMLFICWMLCNVRPLEEGGKQARRAKTQAK